MAFPWKKPFFDKLTISSRLAEGRRVNYISPKVLSCSGLHAPKRQAELGFLPQLPTLTDLLKDHPTISLPTSATELPKISVRQQNQELIFQQPHVMQGSIRKTACNAKHRNPSFQAPCANQKGMCIDKGIQSKSRKRKTESSAN